ncbi:MAG: efflux transporter outer membrane subunit [Burkholderiales bacterium]|nr:efflux transporter outer membrane subunit [Burkholderiales bacterium]
MRTLPFLFSIAAAAVLSACASMGPATERAKPVDAATLQVGDAFKGSDAQWPQAQWWTSLGDNQLNDLIADALRDSPTLAVARARIDKAAAIAGVVHADAGPQIGLDAEVDSQHFQRNSVYPPPLAGTTNGVGLIQLQGSWDLDFFGKHQAEFDTALSQTRAAEFQRQAVALALASDISRTYVQLALQYDLLDVLDATEQQRENVLEVNRTRVAAGLDPAGERNVANASLASVRQERAAIEGRISVLQDRLASLAGVGPARGRQLHRPQLAIGAVDGIPDMLPAELVARRPDIAAQRARLNASLREIDLAKSQFYPDINLAGFIGVQSIGLGNLLKWDSHMTGVGPALHLPVFDGGALRSNLRVTQAEFDGAVADYNALVIQAMQQTADAVANERAVATQLDEQNKAEDEVKEAYRLAQLRYEHGLSSRLLALNAEDRVLGETRQRAELAAQARLAWVDLNHALGGGFHTATAQAAR